VKLLKLRASPEIKVYSLDMNETNIQSIKRLVIAGGSGFLGAGLIRHLAGRVESVVVLTRGLARQEGRVRLVPWDAKNIGPWVGELDGASALVNLVGRTVNCRKTAANKAVILSSRVDSMAVLGAAMRACAAPPPVWIQSGTAHIYGDTDDQILDESSPIGTGFAPQVGLAWEAALREHAPPGMRTVVLRISFVMGRHGGALATLARLARFGLGGATGSGRQYMSWIHEADLYRIIERAIVTDAMRGEYVVTAPNPETNRDFMRMLRRAVHRPWSPPLPEIVVRFGSVMLRTDPELALLGRRCMPTRLLHEGFTFEQPNLAGALADLLGGN
jgi:uncharacterized protein (TIGR01777 family)